METGQQQRANEWKLDLERGIQKLEERDAAQEEEKRKEAIERIIAGGFTLCMHAARVLRAHCVPVHYILSMRGFPLCPHS